MLTHVNFIATSLKPLDSNLLIIFPTSPLCIPSGLTIIKVLSLAAAIAFENKEKIDRIVQITIRQSDDCWGCKDSDRVGRIPAM